MTDKRSYFCLGAGVLVLAMEPMVPEYSWATLTIGIVYFVLAALFGLASFSAHREARRHHAAADALTGDALTGDAP